MENVSVIICCYNSVNRIYDTLLHLSKQDSRNINWELILVNNASTDETGKFAAQAWEKIGLKSIPFKIVDEKTPGLLYARKKGIEEAAADLLIFCDDDNWLYPDYIYNAYQIYTSHPRLGIFSPSKCYGVYEVAPPEWFLKRKDMVAVYDVDLNKTASSAKEDVFCGGAGMCMNKTFGLLYLQNLNDNNFRKLLGRNGDKLLSGEDTDLNFMAYKTGFETGLFNNLQLEHYIPKERISKRYLLKLKYAMAYSSTLVSHINNIQTKKWTIGGLIKYLLLTGINDPFEMRLSLKAFAGTVKANKLLKKN